MNICRLQILLKSWGKVYFKRNSSLLVQCVQSKARASFSEIISLVKTIMNQTTISLEYFL